MLLKLAILVGGFAVFQLLYRFFRHVTSPLRSVPGPFLARFTNLWYFFTLKKANFEVVNRELHEKYGALASPKLLTFVYVLRNTHNNRFIRSHRPIRPESI